MTLPERPRPVVPGLSDGLNHAGPSARQVADHIGHAKPSMTQDLYMGRSVAAALTNR